MSLPSSLLNTRVFIENKKTSRYLFDTGEKLKGPRGSEGGWLASSGFQAPKLVGADANYYNKAYYKIEAAGDYYYLVNESTDRYAFADGSPIKGDRGSEGGWKASSGFEAPEVLGADANYYDGALWSITPHGDGFLIESKRTKRYLFADGGPIKGERGAEGGWLASSGFESPDVKGADANYYDHAVWKISPA